MVTVVVNPTPDVLASAETVCDGGTTSVAITNPNGVSGTTFSWTIGTVTGTVSGQTAGSGTVITQTLSSTAGGTVEYLITATANGCSSAPFSVVVTVEPLPVGTPVAQGTYFVCSGESLNITPVADIVGTTFTWTGDNGSGGTGNITRPCERRAYNVGHRSDV